MLSDVLYYPYINVPNNDWFKRAFLYWDSVGSIVPWNFTGAGRNKLQTHMIDLIESGIVQEIIPDAIIKDRDKFNSDFLINLDSVKIKEQQPIFIPQTYQKIHVGKLGGTIASELEKMGLAKQLDYEWFQVERTTASLFMSYLAIQLCNLDSTKRIPITDKPSIIYNQYCNRSILRGITRDKIIEALLPVPVEEISTKKLLEFRRKYHESIVKFRNYIEKESINLYQYDAEDYEDSIELFIQEYKENLDDLIDKMKSVGWKQVLFTNFWSYVLPGTMFCISIAEHDYPKLIESSILFGDVIIKTAAELSKLIRSQKFELNSKYAFPSLIEKYLQ
jgi:hypothetical protein